MNARNTIDALWGDTPFVQYLKQCPADERLRLVEEMDAEEARITDPDRLRLVEAEHRAIRMLVRMFAEAG